MAPLRSPIDDYFVPTPDSGRSADCAGVLVAPTRKAAAPRASREQGRARAPDDYRCVELRYPGNACDAVKQWRKNASYQARRPQSPCRDATWPSVLAVMCTMTTAGTTTGATPSRNRRARPPLCGWGAPHQGPPPVQQARALDQSQGDRHSSRHDRPCGPAFDDSTATDNKPRRSGAVVGAESATACGGRNRDQRDRGRAGRAWLVRGPGLRLHTNSQREFRTHSSPAAPSCPPRFRRWPTCT